MATVRYFTVKTDTVNGTHIDTCSVGVVWVIVYNCWWPVGRDSDSQRAGRSEDRILVEARFSAPVHTGPVAHPASCTTGTESIPRVKRPGRCVGHPPTSSAEVKERIELYLHFPSGPSWPVLGQSWLLVTWRCGLQYPNGSEGHNCYVEFLVDLQYQFLSNNLLMPIAVWV